MTMVTMEAMEVTAALMMMITKEEMVSDLLIISPNGH